MSETGTKKFDATIAPLSGVVVATQGQVGPQIVGSGLLTFQGPGNLNLYYAPQQVGQSSVKYANNFGNPNIPLQPGVWTAIPNVQGLHISYQVNPGSDIKLAWALSN